MHFKAQSLSQRLQRPFLLMKLNEVLSTSSGAQHAGVLSNQSPQAITAVLSSWAPCRGCLQSLAGCCDAGGSEGDIGDRAMQQLSGRCGYRCVCACARTCMHDGEARKTGRCIVGEFQPWPAVSSVLGVLVVLS